MSTPPLPYSEDLISPYSEFRAFSLASTKYPEKSPLGLAIRQTTSFSSWVLESWADNTIGDNYMVYFNNLNVPAASFTVQALAPRYNLTITAAALPRGDVQYFSRVLRAGSFQESRSPVEWIFIKTTHPGGFDRMPHLPYHSELKLSVLGLKEGDVIDPDIAASGLECLIEKYPNIRFNDEIELFYDGISVIYIVSPADEAGPGPIRIPVPEAIILQGTLWGPVTLVFTVSDVVGNTPGGTYQFSKGFSVNAELKSGLLDSPIVLVNDTEASLINLNTDSKAQFAADISLPRQTPAPNPRNKVTVVLLITQADGTTRTVRLPAVEDKNLRGERVPIPNDVVLSAAGGRIRTSFQLHAANGTLKAESGSFTVMVVGKPEIMPAVTLSPIQAGLVAPNTDLTLVMPNDYQPYDPNWLETYFIQLSKPGGGGEIYSQTRPAGPPGGTVIVPKAALKVFEGKGPIEVFYRTNDGTGTSTSIRESERLTFQIGTRVATLPKPLILGEENGNIDLENVKELLMIFPVTDTVDTNRLHYTILGRKPGSSISGVIPITKATEGAALQSVLFPGDYRILTDNEGASVSGSYSVVSTSGQVRQSEIFEATIGEPLIIGLPRVLEADAFQNKLFPERVLNGANVRVDVGPIRLDDQFFLDWLGQFGVSTITVQKSGDPAAKWVDFFIPASVIAKGIRLTGNKISIQARLTRGRFEYKSAIVLIDLQPVLTLPEPKFKGVIGNILDVSQLSQTPEITIAPWDFSAAQQTVWVTLKGTQVNGTPYVKDLRVAAVVTPADVGGGLIIPVDLAELQQLKDGTALTIEALVSMARSPDKTTAIAFTLGNFIMQLLPTTLAPPMLKGASGTGPAVSVDPLAIQNSTVVTVAYAGMLKTDVITLSWIHANGTIKQVTANGVATGSVDVDLTADKVLNNSVNSTVELKYSIVRSGKIIPSNVQKVSVGTIAPSKLPQPIINALAPGATLVFNNFSGDAMAALALWPLIKEGQTVWLTLAADGKELNVLAAYAINAAEEKSGLVSKAVLRGWLAGVPTNKSIEVECWVAFDGGNNKASAVQFPKTKYTFDIKLRPPAIVGVVTATGRSVPYNGAYNFLTEGRLLTYHGTCDSRPYVRYMYLTTLVSGVEYDTFGFTVLANATTVTVVASQTGLPVIYNFLREFDDRSVKSNVWAIRPQPV